MRPWPYTDACYYARDMERGQVSIRIPTAAGGQRQAAGEQEKKGPAGGSSVRIWRGEQRGAPLFEASFQHFQKPAAQGRS